MNIAPDVPIVNANSESPRKHFMNSSMSTSIDVNLSQKNKIKTLNKPPNNPEKKIRSMYKINNINMFLSILLIFYGKMSNYNIFLNLLTLTASYCFILHKMKLNYTIKSYL